MAKRLIGLRLHEFSLVLGDDKEPANQGCTAEFYKAADVQEDSIMKLTEKTQQAAPAPTVLQRAAKTLIDAASTLLGKETGDTAKAGEPAKAGETAKAGEPAKAGETEKATRTVDREDKYTSTSTSRTVETIDDAQPPVQQPAGDVAMATDKAAPALAAAIDRTAKAIVAINGRLTKLEEQPVGSRVLKSYSSVAVTDNAAPKFPEFAKFLAGVSGLTPGQRLSKATITTQGWTYGLSVDEAKNFIDYIVDQSTLLKRIRTVQMTAPTANIDKIGLGGKVLVKGTPGTDPGDTVSLSGPTQVQLKSEELIGIVSVGDDTLEDNIEGEAFLQHLLRMIAAAAANEIEQAAIHGDTDVEDEYILDRWDGFLKLAVAGGAHVIDAMEDDDRYWPGANGRKATRLLKALPTKYRQDVRNLAWLLHSDLYLDYNDELASKGYSEAWAAITGIKDVPLRGIQNLQVPLLKTDIEFTVGEGASAEEYDDGTVVMLTDLRNLIVGIQRNIRIEPFRQPRKRATDFVLTMRGAVQIENADAIAIYNHAKVRES